MFLPKLARIARALSLDVWFRMRDPTTGARRFPYPPVDDSAPVPEDTPGGVVKRRDAESPK